MFATLETFLQTKGMLHAADFDKICACFSLVSAKRNTILLDFSQVSKHYFFVNKGCVRLFTYANDGSESSRYFAFEGNFVTALPSFIDQLPAEEYLQCIEKSELLCISRDDFYQLTQEIPLFGKVYTTILELGFIMAQKRIYGFQGFDALEKVRWCIVNQPQLLLRVSNKMVASYLGMSPSTLSRIKSKL